MPKTPEQVASKLKQNKGTVNNSWGRLTDAERLKITQKRTVLVGKIQKHYGQHQKTEPPTEE